MADQTYYPPPPSHPAQQPEHAALQPQQQNVAYPPPTSHLQGQPEPGQTAAASQEHHLPEPPLPPRPGNFDVEAQQVQQAPAYHPADYAGQSPFQTGQQFQLPPQRHKQTFAEDDNPSNPAHFIRDPHKLIGYLVLFPRHQLHTVNPEDIPIRFMIYTPPPPPLQRPGEGAKEAKLHKVQRKWQEEVRSAKTSDAKVASWKGVKSRATKGINWAMNVSCLVLSQVLYKYANDARKLLPQISTSSVVFRQLSLMAKMRGTKLIKLLASKK